MSESKIKYIGQLRVQGGLIGFPDIYTNDVVKKFGGLGEHPPPSDMLLFVLGACGLTMMAMRAKKLDVDIEGSTASVIKEIDKNYHYNKFILEFTCPYTFDEEIVLELKEAVYNCAVNQAIDKSIEKEHIFKWGQQ